MLRHVFGTLAGHKIAILIPRACKKGIKSKSGAIKCYKEKKLLPCLMSGVTFQFIVKEVNIKNNIFSAKNMILNISRSLKEQFKQRQKYIFLFSL